VAIGMLAHDLWPARAAAPEKRNLADATAADG
jgi:hypothetical protein